MLILLLIILIVFLLLAWITLNKDFFQPSCLVIISFIACTSCALIMQSRWQYEYHFKTIFYILLGLSVIYVANLVFCKCRIQTIKKNYRKNETLEVTNVSLLFYFLMLCVQIVSILLYYKEIIRIAGSGKNISTIMANFREFTSYGTKNSVSFIATQFLNFSFAICIINLYVFIKNTLIQGIKGNVKFLFSVLLYIFNSLMTGGRFSSLVVIITGITMFVILYRKIFRCKLSTKFWIYIIITVLILLVGFYFIRKLIGRTSTTSQKSSFIQYISSYIGGSLPLFDMYLQNPVESSTIWGKETFYAINNQLIEWGFIDIKPYLTHLEARTYNGYSLGNIYTGFRRNLQDFGISGMIFFQFIFGAIMSGAYNKIRKSNSEFGTILYCSIAYVLWLHGQNDYFYTRVISFGQLELILLLYVLYYCIIKKRLDTTKVVKIENRNGKDKKNDIKTVILFPNKNNYIFKYIKSDNCKIYNVYKNQNCNKLVKIFRKLIYFIGMGYFNSFYSDWTRMLKNDIQFIVFDSCKPYHRLQKKLKKAKIKPIIYFWNPVGPKDKIEQLKKYFKVYSYSIQDAQKYGLNYNPQFFVDVPINEKNNIIYDTIFIGKNKKRLKELEKIYNLFNNPYFYVVKDGNEISNILNLQDKQMPYEEYIKLLSRSKSILEILYTENADYSLRTMESIFLQKKLITNNNLVVHAPFYNKNNIYLLNENTVKRDIEDFINIPFVPYCEEQINFYKFDQWLKRFEKSE